MDASFSIASSDRLAGKSNVSVTLGFIPLNAVPPGGTITLTYPASFFTPSASGAAWTPPADCATVQATLTAGGGGAS